jgi:serine/threonine protein kinase
MTSADPISPLHKSIALPGRRKVTLVAELGRGSAAVAYRAILETDSFVRRPVVVKLYDLGSSDEPESALITLGRAAQRAGYVVHPNAVQTYELAMIDRRHALVITELVEGTTLASFMARRARVGRRIPLDLALFVTTEIAEGLSGARMATTPEGVHAGIAHLDVTTQQVLLSNFGEVKLSDFGLGQVARWGSGVRSRQSGHGLASRAASTAPEMARGRAGDTRSDVFSLGIVLREMLIGPRFAADVTETQALEHARDGHVPPTFLELQIHTEVRAILQRALEVDPARRYPHATAMAYDLRRVGLSMGVGDGRMFLRSLIAELGALEEPIDPITDEHPSLDEITPREIPGDRESGLVLKATKLTIPTPKRLKINGTDE